MLTQRLSWFVAPGRVLELSNSRASTQHHPYSCATTPAQSSTPYIEGTPLFDRLSRLNMSVRALPSVPGSDSSESNPPSSFSQTASSASISSTSSVRPLPIPPSKSQVSLSTNTSGSTVTVRPLPKMPSSSTSADNDAPLPGAAESVAPSPTLSNQVPSDDSSPSPSRTSPLSRLGKKKRQLSKDLLKFGESVDSVPDFMIPQHHLQTQPCSPSKPPTPSKPPRLNLGLFRARKESNVAPVGQKPSEPCEETHLGPNTGSLRKRGSSTTGMFRSPSPGAVGMRKAASAGAGPVIESAKPVPPSPPPKPAKLKAQAQGLLNTAIGIGMSLGTRASVTSVMPTSPSIAAAIEYMRHEHDPPRRAVLDEKRDEDEGNRDTIYAGNRDTIYAGDRSTIYAGNQAGRGGSSSHEQLARESSSQEHLASGSQLASNSRERLASNSREHLDSPSSQHRSSSSQEQLPRSSRETLDEESDAESRKVHGQPSVSDFSQGHKTSFSDAGKSSFSDAADTSSGPSSSVNSLLSSNTGTGTSAHTDDDNHDADVSFGSDSSCFDSFTPAARPQSRAAQDPDKRVSTASSQRTVMAWNSGGFVFPNTSNVDQGAPLARLHTTDGNLDEPEPDPLPKPTPRPARLGQIAGSLKRRSASMSILLPPMMSPRSPEPSSEASSPRFIPSSPPPVPPRPRPRAHFDGAVTDSEGTSVIRKRSRRVQGGIKGRIAAWTAAAEQNRPKKHTRAPTTTGTGVGADEPRRSDSPGGYPYSHSPASAPALQVHTHVHLPTQTPLMSIAALAPAARDLALGVGKRVEKFYRARSASGAGHEPRPSLGGRNVPVARGGMGVGAEPVLSALLKPAVPGASGLLFGRSLDDPGVPMDMDGWVDETLGVRRCVGVPVFVSRSVRHLERWGGDEEGLFRISGRPSHVARLRAEFDAGADYDLYEIPPGDLDPHAVSHLFKAYLRQLPEPILTRALKGQFDAAMTIGDSSSDASKPASMASFGESSENMRSLDDELLSDIKVLVDQLPQVNYNLLHELCHLLRYTTEHAHTTKMPLGNLLLLFCPTLGFSAGFLRCLVEGQDVLFEWGRKPPSEPLAPPPLPPRSIKTSVSTVTGPSPSPGPKHTPSASATVAPSSIRSIKSPLAIATDPTSPRARSHTTGTGSGPPSRASMFFPNLPKRPSISRLFGVGNSNLDFHGASPEPRRSSSSGESYMTSDDDDQAQYVHPKRQTLPPRVSLDIPDGSFAPSLSPTKDAPEAESGASSATTKRPAQTPIADMFKSPLTAAVPTIAPSAVTATAVSSSKTLPPRLGLQLGNSEGADEMGWSRGVLDAATSASLGR